MSDQSPMGSPATSPIPTPARSSEGLTTAEVSEDFTIPTEKLTAISQDVSTFSHLKCLPYAPSYM